MSQTPASPIAGGRSPLAPPSFPDVAPVSGVTLVGAAIGLKKTPGQKDLLLVRLAPGTTIAGTLTRSRCPSAPVDWCRQHLPGGRAQAIVVNSANANAFTGNVGDLVVGHTVDAAAKLFDCPRSEVFIASTGVIGEPVPPHQIGDSLA
ncbi:MAG: bifunctional ornithine acetyltransferase/N-acetylglutamate synthase, partial [Alphaproteobacteria bacterium]